jgi:hypothetical protein
MTHCPGAYELNLAADHVTVWYTVSVHQGREIISIQLGCLSGRMPGQAVGAVGDVSAWQFGVEQ